MAEKYPDFSYRVEASIFVDCAEFIWKEAEGKTQEEISNIIGWGRGKVSQYVMLKNICPEAWKLIATTFENNVAIQNEGDVAEFATNVAVFSEGLLRSILPLTSSQQTELVKDLISGSITKGRFKSLAQAYKAHFLLKKLSINT